MHNQNTRNQQILHPQPARPNGYATVPLQSAFQESYQPPPNPHPNQPYYSTTPSGFTNPNAQGPLTYYAMPPQFSQQPAPNYSAQPQTTQVFSNMMSDPTAQIGMQIGSKAFQAGQQYVNQNINRYFSMPKLKTYFNVSVSYVRLKLSRLLFPFMVARWERSFLRKETGIDEYLPPREDVNAPDLYIPLMGFISFVLLTAVHDVLRNDVFHPEVLGFAATKAFISVAVEMTLVKFGCYIFSVQAEIPLLDLGSYSGYKFVCVVISLITALPGIALGNIIPGWIFWTVLLYTCIALGMFSLRSMRYIVIPEGSTQKIHNPQRRTRIHFLLALSFLQMLSCIFLVMTTS